METIMRQALRRAMVMTSATTLMCSTASADSVVHNRPQSIPGGTVLSAVVEKGSQTFVVEGLNLSSSVLSIVSPDMAHATLAFKGIKLDEVEGGLNFDSVTHAGSHTFVVIGEMLGGASNPSHIKVVDISESGAVLSPDLGESGDSPKVMLTNGVLKLSMTHTSDQPDRTVSLVKGQVQSMQSASFALSSFETDDCVGPSAGHEWHVYSHPKATVPVNVPASYYGLFVTKQSSGWTGLSTVQGGSKSKGWMRTVELRNYALAACAANPQ